MNLSEDAMNTVCSHDTQAVSAARLPVQWTCDYHVAVLWINAECVIFIAI